MTDRIRSIGTIARESGLSVSALRFYDAAGVLPPASVDPATGYRRYTAEQVDQARLIASLRRVGMPLVEICQVLAVRHEPSEASRLLDAHLHRLEDSLADARRHLDIARDLVARKEHPVIELSVRGRDLTGALAAIRFAVSADQTLPALNGVLFDYDGNTLRLVASDRYRLAVATVESRGRATGQVRAIAPVSLLDDLMIEPERDVRLRLHDDSVTIGSAHAAAINAVFPDYQRMLRSTSLQRIAVTTADLQDRLRTGPTRWMRQEPNDSLHEISVVVFTDQNIDVVGEGHADAVGFNREFLLQALDANGSDQLLLALDGPIGPLSIIDPDRPEDISLLMPTRL